MSNEIEFASVGGTVKGQSVAQISIVLKNVEGLSLVDVFDAFRASLDCNPNKVILTDRSSCYFFFEFPSSESGDVLFNVVHK